MRTLLMFFIVPIIILSCSSNAETNKKPDTTGDAIPVRLAPVTGDSSVNTIHASGLISTEDEARLSFKIGGIIDQVLVEEGQFVKKGQLLATLKSTEIASQVNQVQLAVEKAQRDYQRAQNLYNDSVATLEQLQNARTGLEMAKQNLQQVSFNQQYSKIYAVSDGFIAKKLLNAGELANSGSAVLVMGAVSGKSKWILRAGVADREWAAIETGNRATVTTDAFPGKTFNARVSKKALAADAVSGSFQVELQVDFGKDQPAMGLFGNAIITSSKADTVFSIPYEALLEADGKNGFVFVTDDRKKVKRVQVTIGSIDNNRVYIQSGIEDHRYVVVSGSPYLSDGSLIAVVQ
jgi:RND family efflux transporter MFP subunit